MESVLAERYGLKGQLWYKEYFHMVYRLKDIAKLLNFLFKSELNLNLLKSEIFQFREKIHVLTNLGV